MKLPSYALSIGSKSLNAQHTNYSHLPTKFSQPLNLHTVPSQSHLWFSVRRPRSTHSSSVVTLAQLPTSSSLKINDWSFRYASPCLWNQLHLSLRQPHFVTISSISDSPIPSPITSSFDSPLCSTITQSLFYSRLKTYLSHKSFHP